MPPAIQNLFLPIRFTFVRRLYIPKFSSIPCLKWDLRDVGNQRPSPVVVGLKKRIMEKSDGCINCALADQKIQSELTNYQDEEFRIVLFFMSRKM